MNREECWNEMHNYLDFGWVKGNVIGEYKQVKISKGKEIYGILIVDNLFKHYTNGNIK